MRYHGLGTDVTAAAGIKEISSKKKMVEFKLGFKIWFVLLSALRVMNVRVVLPTPNQVGQ